MTINELLDQARNRANLQSDYALAKAMGIDRAVVSAWRKGRKHPSNEEAVQLATLAGLKEMQVIAAIEYETANNDKKKEFWKHFIESRGLAATIGIIGIGITIIATPEPAEAGILQLRNYDAQKSVFEPSEIYIMRISE